MPDASRYIVRGAKMVCNCGSHARKINLPVSHGSYVNGKPMMNQTDSVPIVNVTAFGVCKNPANPSPSPITLMGENGSPVVGKPCVPAITSCWMNTKYDTKVDGLPALTTDSILMCTLGGMITFKTDGQQDE
jgi:PAB1-binding protein PBP1